MFLFVHLPPNKLIHRLGTLIEAAKSGSVSRFIGRSQSEDSVCKSPNHSRKESASNSPNSEAVTESPSDSNPSLDKPDEHKNHHSSDKNSNNKSNHSKSHHHHLHLNFGALAALKRKRKKFSASRNESPVLEPPPEYDSPASNRKSVKKVIYWLCIIFNESGERLCVWWWRRMFTQSAGDSEIKTSTLPNYV